MVRNENFISYFSSGLVIVCFILFSFLDVSNIPEKWWPYGCIFALQDNTIFHYYPRSHTAAYHHITNKRRKYPPCIGLEESVSLSKGELFVFNALMLHKGHGHGDFENTRLHFYFVYPGIDYLHKNADGTDIDTYPLDFNNDGSYCRYIPYFVDSKTPIKRTDTQINL